MGMEELNQSMNLFNMDFLSSVTAMVLAVNLITQIIKEVFLPDTISPRIPKLITLLASAAVISVNHYTQWLRNPQIFNYSILELIFLIFINSMFIAALSMGNYKVLNLTKERELKDAKEQIFKIEMEKLEAYAGREEDGELH